MIGAPEGTKIDGPAKAEVKFTLGDINDDGIINAVDLVLAKRGVLTEKFDSEAAELAADVNQDGNVTVADIVWYTKYLTGQVTDFEKA